MAEMHRLFDPASSTRGDVIFVHGLDGDALDSWSLRAEESWVTWLSAARPDLRLWSVGYDAASSKWRGGAMPLVDRAVNILATLDGNGLGVYPICFVTHSMGGLVAKQLLREATSTSVEYRAIASSVRGVVFLATPHTGADLASLARFLRVVLRTTEAAEELTAHAPALRDLNRWFRNNAGTLELGVKVFFETHPYRGVLVVDAASADPGLANVTPIPVDADHVTICKPSGPSDVVFQATVRFLAEVLPIAPPAREDELQMIRQRVLAAQNPRDLEYEEARLQVYLSRNPATPEALVLQQRIKQALERERTHRFEYRIESRAPDSYRRQPRLFESSPLGWIATLVALGLLLAGAVKLVQWLF